MHVAQAAVLTLVASYLGFRIFRHRVPRGLRHVLTASQVAHFKTHGRVAVPDFWPSADIEAVRAALTLLQATGRLANVATEGDGKTHTKIPRNLSCGLR